MTKDVDQCSIEQMQSNGCKEIDHGKDDEFFNASDLEEPQEDQNIQSSQISLETHREIDQETQSEQKKKKKRKRKRPVSGT